jgi:hypothetical protein
MNYGWTNILERNKKKFPKKNCRNTINHAIFKTFYFPSGLQKFMNTMANVHKALEFYRQMDFALHFECDLGDGWENPKYTMTQPL